MAYLISKLEPKGGSGNPNMKQTPQGGSAALKFDEPQ